ncbi:DUF7373 family lipoprotein [Tsukamurella ocularis]|uniref:DUF7373 family lipoprotein n=1 Tax=Tsukamurella ocularis TaxID=1970234 RepID=UPI0039EF0891
MAGRSSIVLAEMAAGVLLAGCSTTVVGSPVVDPSGMPKPEVGSYPTTPRTVAPVTDAQASSAEGYRMAEIIPLPPDVDPSQRYNGAIVVGRPDLASAFGAGVATALKDMEVAAYTSATSRVPGASSVDTTPTSLVMGFARMKDAAAATAASAHPAVLAPEKARFGTADPTKRRVTVPGHPDATAYLQTWPESRATATVAVQARGQYVLFAYATTGVDAPAKFFDLQSKALGGFTPTPVDKFGTLPKDRENLLQYTLPPEAPRDVVLPARTAVVDQSDITGSVTNFADAGVDYVARAGNTVYRARDAAGAALLADRFVAEAKGFFSDAVDSTVKGVPRSRCVAFTSYKGAKDTSNYCVVPVGRYVAEMSGAQAEKVKQATGASYLMLRDLK